MLFLVADVIRVVLQVGRSGPTCRTIVPPDGTDSIEHITCSCTDPDVLTRDPHTKVVKTQTGLNAVMVGYESQLW